MALNQAKRSAAIAPVGLASDFGTWYSGVPWTWKPNETEKGKAMSTAVSPAEVKSNIEEKSDSQIRSSEILLTSANLSSFHETKPISADELPLHVVAPYFEVKKSAKGGYGAFALQDIPTNTEILSETALLEAKSIDILERFEDLSDREKEAFLKLARFDQISSNPIRATFKTNRFEISNGNCAVFLIASRFNHSCVPSCTYHYKPDKGQLVLVTKSYILAGQEITISYGQTGEELLNSWGFRCDCRLCCQLW